MKAVVLEGTGGVWRVRTETGETLEVSLRGRLKQARESRRGRERGGRANEDGAIPEPPKLAVGDEVVIEPDARGGAWAIAEILPRRSRLARRAPGGAQGERIVAANVDQVVVVFAAARPEPHPRMLDRFLVIAEGNGLAARVVINKVDLAGDAEVRLRFADYERAGYPVHYTSVRSNLGLASFRDALAGQASVLTGPSGVGKSSLLNALYPGLGLRVGEISESVNKGRHTTVGAMLHPLPPVGELPDGYVVDTPGLREVGMWGLPLDTLDKCYPEFRPYLTGCRFADCTHRAEPECAVRDAVERGDVSRVRYESYLKLRAEVAEGEQIW